MLLIHDMHCNIQYRNYVSNILQEMVTFWFLVMIPHFVLWQTTQ